MTFPEGASLEDPSGPFNASLEGNAWRAIDIHEGDKVDEEALKDLILAAVALNLEGVTKAKLKPKPRRSAACGPASLIAGSAARLNRFLRLAPREKHSRYFIRCRSTRALGLTLTPSTPYGRFLFGRTQFENTGLRTRAQSRWLTGC
jgi:hypothetical protein